MKALALAFAVSIALHAAVFAALPRGGLETRAAPALRLPAAVDVEISVTRGVAPEARLALARSEPARRRRHPSIAKSPPPLAGEGQGGGSTNSFPTPTATATPTPTTTATPTATPTTTATTTATSTTTATAITTATTTSTAITTASNLDLTAFFDRLERAAQRCAGPRSGEGRVRFCVGADGAPTDVSLVQTTGNFALDDAALHCVIPGAAPFPRTSRCLVVPLAFH